MIVRGHRATPRRCERAAPSDGRNVPGGEGGPVQPRPAPPPRPPRDRSRRTRPNRSSTPTRTTSSAPKNKQPGTSAPRGLHDNGDGTTTGHFTIPALAAATLGKVIDAMTAPRRMREKGTTPEGTDPSTGGTAADSRSSHASCDGHATPSTEEKKFFFFFFKKKKKKKKKKNFSPEPRTWTLQPRYATRFASSNCGFFRDALGCTPFAPQPKPGEQKADRQRSRTHHLRRHRLRTALRLVLQLHHRGPWAPGGHTDLDDAIPVCAFSTTTGSTTPGFQPPDRGPTAASGSAGEHEAVRP